MSLVHHCYCVLCQSPLGRVSRARREILAPHASTSIHPTSGGLPCPMPWPDLTRLPSGAFAPFVIPSNFPATIARLCRCSLPYAERQASPVSSGRRPSRCRRCAYAHARSNPRQSPSRPPTSHRSLPLTRIPACTLAKPVGCAACISVSHSRSKQSRAPPCLLPASSRSDFFLVALQHATWSDLLPPDEHSVRDRDKGIAPLP